jgi:hypothetical protein
MSPKNALRTFGFLFLAGCGANEVVGCDFRADGPLGPEAYCEDRTGSANLFEDVCLRTNGQIVEGGCSTTGAVAGCDRGADDEFTSVIGWYYEPTTRVEVETECAEDGGTVIDP